MSMNIKIENYKTLDDGTIVKHTYAGDKLIAITYEKNGLLHNTSGPAKIYFNIHSNEATQEYYLNGVYYYDIMQWMVAVGNLEEE